MKNATAFDEKSRGVRYKKTCGFFYEKARVFNEKNGAFDEKTWGF